jgi:cytochrome c553
MRVTICAPSREIPRSLPMMRPVFAVALFLTGVAHAGPDPFVGGDAEAGAAKAAVCTACHGPGGNSINPEWPSLAGQHALYTYEQLKVLKSGERRSPVMGPQAAGLSDQDMRDLAAYYATQTPKPGVASPDSLEVADPLYRAGDAERGLPACIACHGPQGKGNAAAGYPRVAGQHATYNAAVLRVLRSLPANEFPVGSPVRIMAEVASLLTDAEIDALASYLNGLQ